MKVNPINNNQTNFGAKLKLTGEVKRMQIHRSNRLEELKNLAELIGTKKDVITVNVGDVIRHETQNWSEMGHNYEVTPLSVKILATAVLDNEKISEDKNIGTKYSTANVCSEDLCINCIERFLHDLHEFDLVKKIMKTLEKDEVYIREIYKKKESNLRAMLKS